MSRICLGLLFATNLVVAQAKPTWLSSPQGSLQARVLELDGQLFYTVSYNKSTVCYNMSMLNPTSG